MSVFVVSVVNILDVGLFVLQMSILVSVSIFGEDS
jgi:hypothetical protein